MGTVEHTLKCPICQDLFTDPVALPCGHNFCLSCIRVVWNADVSEVVPFFCPECQIFLPSNLTLKVNTSLKEKVKDFTINGPVTMGLSTMAPSRPTTPSPTIHCDHCIETASVAIKTCLTCDASLCQAHALLHQQREALREHTLVEVTGDPLSLKCKEHREELKLFCMEDRVPVCCLCVLVGLHKDHQATQLHKACSDFKKSVAVFRERISDKYSRIRVVLDGDERLMMQIIDTEETYMTEWLEAQRGIMEAHIKEIDNLRASSKSLLKETNDLRFLWQITAQSLGKPLDLPPIGEVDRDLCDLERMRTVERLVDDLSVALSQHLPRMWSYLTTPTLDPKTAHPKIDVSQDRKQVCWSKQPHDEAPGSWRYDTQYSVLAQEGINTGQHYWEVLVQEKPYWLIGVTTGPAPSEDRTAQNIPSLGVNKSFWCIYHGDGQYLACNDEQEKQLPVGLKRVRKLGILADFHKGELSFYDADTLTLLHRFSLQSTEPLYPMLNPCIDVDGLNRQPLTLFWLRDNYKCHVNTEEGKQ
ncbi:nuclear factor 7, brain-like [Lampris incognitus]|uniref:nuclear factor 7, brain-like n=1 Tax=Lampris incognitus TaxID=2546036 RepID=UPI0024B56325|nr:nuclear factor 7, brain-like [Lampris incognitus]